MTETAPSGAILKGSILVVTETPGGNTVSVALTDVPRVALILADKGLPIPPGNDVVVIKKIALVCPAAIVTEAGTATCTSLLLRLTVAPSAGAAELRVSVPIVG